MTVITTLGSWFNDTGTASGISAASHVGISLSNPSASGGLHLGPGIGAQTLKGWFLVKDPGGQLHIFQQIDNGPGSGTSPRRGIDYSQPALSHLAGGDPTNKNSQIVYLGMNEAQISQNLNSALTQIGSKPAKDPGLLAAGTISVIVR